MKRKIYQKYLFFLLMIIFCESFDYVYVDNKTFQRQLSYLNNGFVAIVLQVDPSKKNINMNYAAPGKIIYERILSKKTAASSELIQLILKISKKNKRYIGGGWHPIYDIYIKYTDKLLYFIPKEKYMSVLLDFENSIAFIEGRKFVFDELESKLLQIKLTEVLQNSKK